MFTPVLFELSLSLSLFNSPRKKKNSGTLASESVGECCVIALFPTETSVSFTIRNRTLFFRENPRPVLRCLSWPLAQIIFNRTPEIIILSILSDYTFLPSENNPTNVSNKYMYIFFFILIFNLYVVILNAMSHFYLFV